jgi:hypothetical protein
MSPSARPGCRHRSRRTCGVWLPAWTRRSVSTGSRR